jgi:hypothetical protein
LVLRNLERKVSRGIRFFATLPLGLGRFCPVFGDGTDFRYTPGLHGGVFAAQLGQFIDQILPGYSAQCGRFSDALWPFQNQATIGLRPWSENPSDGRDQPARADGTRVFGVLGAEIGGQPSVHALGSIPAKIVQVRLHWVKWRISRRRLHRLPGDFD